MRKRYFAFVMAMMLVLYIVPVTAYAEEGANSVHDGTVAVESEEKLGSEEDGESKEKEETAAGQDAGAESKLPEQEAAGENAGEKQPEENGEGAEQPVENAGQEQPGENAEESEQLVEGGEQPGEDIVQEEKDEEMESEILPAVNATGDTGEYQPEGTSYKLTYTEVMGGVKITGIIGTKEGELKIPTKIDGMDVVEIGNNAFSSCSGLTGELTIPGSVTVIGENAFLRCRNLTDIIIPESVEKIASNAFTIETWGTESEYFLQPIKITVYSKDVEIAQKAFGVQKILYGYSGSTVEQYAAENGCAFGVIDKPSQISEYRVTNTTEFINAIGSYRRIILADGVYEIVEENYSGGVQLSGIVSLSIEAEHPGKAEILCKPGKDNNGNDGTKCFDPVITVATCEDIEIDGLILGHDGAFGGCNPEAYVVGVSNASNIMINNCDLYGCGSIGVNCRVVNNVNINNSVVRDCQLHIASGSSDSYNGADIKSFCFNSCIMSGHIGHTHAEYYYSALNCFNELYLTDCVLLNNNNPTFDDHSAVITNCEFYNNVWDGGSPQYSGICLNGITWQMDGTVLKLGFPLELDKGTIGSKKGKVMDYSISAAPWKNCVFTEVQYAEGIEKPDKDLIGGGSDPADQIESIGLDKNTLVLFAGESDTLKAIITPENVATASVTWASSDASVATVVNGCVTAVSAGECTITVSEGDKSAVCSVTVLEDNIASGQNNDVTWVIDADGKLTVTGEGDYAAFTSYEKPYDSITRSPWYEYRDQIKSAKIEVKNMCDASWMFRDCANLISVDFSHFRTDRIINMCGMFRGCGNLKNLDLSGFDTRNVYSMNDMFWGCYSLTNLDLSHFDTSQVKNMGGMFDGCSKITGLDLSSFDTSLVSNMSWMFCGCSILTDLNLSSFETGQLMYMEDMFDGCSSLVSLDLSGFDGHSLRDYEFIQSWDEAVVFFDNCDSLTTIYTPYDIRGVYLLPGGSGDVWYQPDGSQITTLPGSAESMLITKNRIPVVEKAYITATMRKTDYVCGDFIATRGLTVKYYDSDGTVKKVTDYTTNEDEIEMSTPGKKRLVITYNGLIAEVELNVSIPRVESITLDKDSLTLSQGEIVTLHAEIYPKSALSLPITWMSSDPAVAKVIGGPINDGYVSAVSGGECTITVSAGDKSADCLVTVASGQSDDDIANGSYENVRWRIDGNGKLIVEGNGDFSGSNSTDRAPWFEKRAFITSAEINLTGTTDASYMFYDCQNLTDIDVSKFDSSHVTDMTWTFRGCSSLTNLDLSSLNTGSVTRMKWMFNDCSKLENLNVSGFDTKNVIDMGGMFDGCCSLTSLDVSSFNTENVRYMNDKGGMFSDCSSLTSLDVSNFDTRNVVDMRYLFMNCESLTRLDLSSFNTENVTAMDGMFSGCSDLTYLDISSFNTQNVSSMSGMFSGCGLTSLNLSNFDVGNVSSFAAFFEVCHKLFTIYVPCNLKISVKLPESYTADSVDIWYDIDGNTYTELPQNLSSSIVLTRNQRPVISEPHITLEKKKTSYVIGEKLTTDDLKVTYYNETGIPSRVNDYATNADEIDMSTPGTKALIVTYLDLCAEIKITVNAKQTEEANGFKITFKNEQDREIAYTGSAIKPEIRVSYNGRPLVEGTNYTVKYANNIKVGNAKITVTGKGNFKSGKTENFHIVQADIADAVFAGTDKTGRLVVVSGSKFAPVIYCGGRKLTANDYTISGAVTPGKKVMDSDSNKVITLNGKGSYTGSKKVNLRVVRKSDLIKFAVTIDKTKLDSLTYDGNEHYIHDIRGALTVTGKDGNANMEYGTDYMIVYPGNVVDAGAKKFSVVGMGLYTGTVRKSYTIKPAVNTNGGLEVNYESGNIDNIKLPYISTGVTFNDQLEITYTKNGNTLTLREGKDYKVIYSGNKKVGSNAKFTISFLGNYKGIQKQTRTFTIEKAELGDATVIIADAVYKRKPGIYKSIPYVIESETGRLIKASSYAVTYYTDSARNMEMKGKNKVSDGDTVYVKLEAKEKSNYKSDKPIVKTYQVKNAIDLSKAKISFMSTATEAATKSAEYTGQKITDREIKVLVNGKPVDADMIVTYADNVDKGKATVIITGTGKPGCRYTGCKKAAFQIVAYSLR